jgi:hypothetical protein
VCPPGSGAVAAQRARRVRHRIVGWAIDPRATTAQYSPRTSTGCARATAGRLFHHSDQAAQCLLMIGKELDDVLSQQYRSRTAVAPRRGTRGAGYAAGGRSC